MTGRASWGDSRTLAGAVCLDTPAGVMPASAAIAQPSAAAVGRAPGHGSTINRQQRPSGELHWSALISCLHACAAKHAPPELLQPLVDLLQLCYM